MSNADVIPFPDRGDPGEAREVDRPLREVVGEVLREERHRQHRTLADVAQGAAVSLPYLSEIERGRKEVSSDLLAAVCDELEVPLAEILDRCADRLRIDSRVTPTFHLLAA